MTEAIFGLVGVVIGALVTGTIEWIQTRRTSAIAIRAARRLVAEELLICVSCLDVAAGAGAPDVVAASMRDSTARGLIRADAWAAHKSILAEGLDDDAWVAVSNAYLEVTFLLGSVEH